MAEAGRAKKICLFDVDGTLTIPRGHVTQEVTDFLAELRKRVTVGVVGGSDLVKQREQLGEDITDRVDFSFSENGLVGFKDGALFHTKTIKEFLGEDRLKELINFCLHYIADLDIPVKRGTFIEFRTGMLNVSPIGRNCSRDERNAFEAYDMEHGVRAKFVGLLREKFGERFGLTFSVGGQISFDVFPTGWDKTYCLPFVEKEGFEEIHFFGDKTYEGGNDYEIFVSDKTIGHTVTSPEETMRICKELFF